MNNPAKIRVAVNGYGVIGKRVAAAVRLQDDMELVGVADMWASSRLCYCSSPKKQLVGRSVGFLSLQSGRVFR